MICFAINKMISFIYTDKNSHKNISMLINYLINSFFLARKLIKTGWLLSL